MRKLIVIATALLYAGVAYGCDKDYDLIAEPLPIEKLPEVETARVYKFKTSRVKRELEFRTVKSTKIC